MNVWGSSSDLGVVFADASILQRNASQYLPHSLNLALSLGVSSRIRTTRVQSFCLDLPKEIILHLMGASHA